MGRISVGLSLRGTLMLLLSLCLLHTALCGEAFKHTNVVLIGATGDLAEKYLWRSLFELFTKHYEKGKHAFSIYGCSRKSPDGGREFMSEILLKIITCPGGDEDCKRFKMKFVEAIQYHQLKTEKHYQALGAKINENVQSMYGLQGTPNSPEDGRLIYLSIPPSAYPKTAQMVNKYLRPEVGRPWFRVVIEKPFGHSLESAKSLLDKLKGSFTEQEMYRIDHYLGKTVVQQILPFRYLNREHYDPLWNGRHVERVEVVMKERLDVKGRTSFYNDVGVLRDVMQNHLTEMAVLVGMELPENSGVIRDLLASKVLFLSQAETLNEQSVVTAQYESYNQECTKELPHVVESVHMPTFAAAVMSVDNPRWHGVPFLLMSGKKLDEKFSYVRVVFRDNTVDLLESKAKSRKVSQIVFHISSGNLMSPAMITVSKSLPKPRSHEDWHLEEKAGDQFFFGESINDTYQLVPKEESEAYTTLLDAVYQGARHMFVDSQSLLHSWKVWNHVIKAIEKQHPRLYKGGKTDPDWLSFRVLGTKALEFIHKVAEIKMDTGNPGSGNPGMGIPEMQQTPESFREGKLVSGTMKDVISKLARDVEEAAIQAVRERGLFHIAFPGGLSPTLLFQHLAAHPRQFPWQQTHIWQVDERCVSQDQTQSNFYLINTHLLKHVPIPYLNIHPMPVDISCEPCSGTDRGDDLYESKLLKLVANTTLDFVLLGVGYDGHIASLFPDQESLQQEDHDVMYSEAGAERVSPKRMTLTYPIINRARNIAVVIFGEKKHPLVEKLDKAEGDGDPNVYPVLGVKPSEDSGLVWYIDDDALYSKFL